MPSILASSSTASPSASSASTKRPRDAASFRPASKKPRKALHLATPHPNGIKPSGNALLGPPSVRPVGLGRLSRLDDDTLLLILASFFQFVDERDDDDWSQASLGLRILARLSSCSKTLYLYVSHDPLWRQALQSRLSNLPSASTQRTLAAWRGTWKHTYISHLHPGSTSCQYAAPRPRIRLSDLYSDALFQPFLLSTLPMEPYVPVPPVSLAARKDPFVPLPRISASEYTPLRFFNEFSRRNRPAIIIEDATELGSPFKQWSCAGWNMDAAFAPRERRRGEEDDAGSQDNWSQRTFQCEAWRCLGMAYREYSRCCERLAVRAKEAEEDDGDQETGDEGDASFDPDWVADESPFYLFDPVFAADKRASEGWRVPELLKVAPKKGGKWRPDEEEGGSHDEEGGEQPEMGHVEADLFSLLGAQRPDFRWIIAGPARSGSGWHKDPNMTSAWNTVLSGRKAWLMLPPTVCPPGVFITEDEAEVTAPLSIVEWLRDYHAETRRLHGPQGDGTLLEGLCERGETVYVPAGWWHLVFNVEETVALTQNLVSPSELPQVLDFMKNRPEQISGFKRFAEDSATSTAVAGGGAEDDEGRSGGSAPEAPPQDMDDCDALDESKRFGQAVYRLFTERLREHEGGELLRWAESEVKGIEDRRAEKERKEGTSNRGEMGGGLGKRGVRKAMPGEAGEGSWWERLKREGTQQAAGKKQQDAPLFGGIGSLVAGVEGEELDDVPW